MFAAYQTAPRRMLLRRVIPLLAADADTTWIHVAMPGTWKGHGAGEFTLTTADFENIIRVFKKQRNPLPLDWEHSTEWAQQAPAAGWVQRLEVRDGGLWAFVEIGAKAAGQIRAGEYKFCSGVFDFGAKDRKTNRELGCVMHSVALTNTPFLDGQEPIALRWSGSKGRRPMAVNIVKLIERLGALEDEEMDAEALIKIVEAQGLDAEALAPPKDAPAPAAPMSDEPEEAVAAGDDPEAPVAAQDGEADAAMLFVQELASALGTDPAGALAFMMDNIDAIVALAGSAEEEPEAAPMGVPAVAASARSLERIVASQGAELTRLRANAEDRRRDDAEAAVDAMVEDGRILEDARKDWTALALSNRSQFERMGERLPKSVPTGRVAGADRVVDASTTPIDESDRDVKAHRRTLSAMGLSRDVQDARIRAFLAKQKSNGAAL